MPNQKAEITEYGTFDEEGNPVGWTFDHKNAPWVPALNVNEDGERLYGGYTIDELRALRQERHS